MRYWLCLAVLSVSFVSCEDFLDKDPDNRVYLDTPEFIENLLATAYPEADIAFAEAMSDCSGDRGLDAILDDPEIQQSYLWKDVVETWQGTPAYYWNEAYKAIAAANHALEAIEKFEADGRADEVRNARGEALLCRAYAHFMLANIFCMPYNPATADAELGIPYVTEPETTLNPTYERETLAETYRLIEEDMIEGLELLPASYENAPAYHFTRKAAYAFASRFYLWKGGDVNFQKSLLYANKVLGDVKTDNPSSMLRQMNNPASDYMGDYYDGQMLYTSSAEPANLLLVAAASNMYYQPYWRYGMTVAIRTELYKRGIFGYSWAYQTSGGYDYLIHRPLWTYYFQQDGSMATNITLNIDGINYMFDANGVRQGGWITLENGTFYYDPATGMKVRGFLDDATGRHYLSHDDGHMVTGAAVIDKKNYLFTPEGVMMTGMVAREDGSYYYDTATGQMLTGWITLGEQTYYADEAGHIVTGVYTIAKQPYYFGADGVLVRNQAVEINGVSYITTPEGILTEVEAALAGEGQ